MAQQPAASQETRAAEVSGTVLDSTGAAIPGASVSLQTPDGATQRTVVSDGRGTYRLDGIRPGRYRITATAQGFNVFQSAIFMLSSGNTRTEAIKLIVAVEEQIAVSSDDVEDTDPSKNPAAKHLGEKEIATMPDDSAQMLTLLQAMAGSDQAQLSIDGFTGGTLPPKDTIRDIRIDENPYSAKNDMNPQSGYIEVFTKPGTDKLHGSLQANGTDSAVNARSPYVAPGQPGYYVWNLNESLSGPLNKHASYFLYGGEARTATNAAVNAVVLNDAFAPVTVAAAVASPQMRYNFSSKVNLQLNDHDFLSVLYSFGRSTQQNAGIGQLALQSEAYHSNSLAQTLQISNTHTFGSHVTYDARLQYLRNRAARAPDSNDPTLNVQGSFQGGGSPSGSSDDRSDRFELQNYVAILHKAHSINTGVRLRVNRESNRSSANYSGQYTFATLSAYQITKQGLATGLSSQQIRQAGGGAQQFSITFGSASAAVEMADVAAFLQDDWKLNSRTTLSGGMRFESQTGMPDHNDWAPRFGIAWAIGRKKTEHPRLTFRAGAGLFYHRFDLSNLLQATRQNGLLQRQYVVNSPDTFPNIPSEGTLGSQAQSTPTIYRIGSDVRATDTIDGSMSLTYLLGKIGSVSVTYNPTRTWHVLITRNANAPLPGTYNPADPTSGVRPLGTQQNIYQYDASGVDNWSPLTANFNLNLGPRISLFGNARKAFVHNNMEPFGAPGFPSNSYDLHADYGRSTLSVFSMFTYLSARLPWKLALSTQLSYRAGAPFNITVGNDLNGDAQFNDRPAFATDLTRASVYRTKWGNFDASPLPGQTIIPRNYGTGPAMLSMYIFLGKTIPFGPRLALPPGAKPPANGKPAPVARRYTLDLNVSSNNPLNIVNPGTPVGVLGSPLFGKSTSLTSQSYGTANRTLSFSVSTRF